ncbi:MAG: lysylphosphatidylglycerol synthase transmembrane domain-containing protein [Microcoleus sp.]
MKFRTWLSIITLFAIILILFIARHDLAIAWQLLDRVNIWILLLMIPVQFIGYFSVGKILFSYLQSKGELVKVNSMTMARIALELNFVNHALPSGGVSGISYSNWRFKHFGVPTSRTTMAQVVRYSTTFGVYITLLLFSLLLLTVDGTISRFTVLSSSFIAGILLAGGFFGVYVIGSETRLKSFSQGLSKAINKFGQQILRRRKQLVSEEKFRGYFHALHLDYIELVEKPRDLVKPLIWAFVFNISEVLLFIIAFAALGQWVNPAPILIAYGIAGLAGFFVVTPGGAGAYEAIMISFLVTAGIGQGTAIAGILLARVILIIGTISSGYIFYQLALLRYGKNTDIS